MQNKKENLILINANSSHIRIIQLKEGILFNLHWENRSCLSRVGEIYKSTVIKAQPSIDACFVDIGLGQSGFLYTGKKVYAKSFVEDKTKENKLINSDNGVEITEDSNSVTNKASFKERKPEEAPLDIKQNQSVMVQVIKDSLKGKSLKVSHKISLPGLYLVYLPNSESYIGISRQIEDEKTRQKLTQYVQEGIKDEAVIVRTKAIQASAEDFKQDLEKLKKTWKNIQEKYDNQKRPGLIWSDAPFFTHIVKDFLTEEIQHIIVDDKEMFLFFQDWATQNLVEGSYKISQHTDTKSSLFDKYDLEPKLEKLLRKKVKLKSGACIILEETEAAVIIDVNTSSFVGKKSSGENMLQTNLEAAKEIANQIRLRNCGGIILIDFIDMEITQSRQAVIKLLTQELEKDKVPTQVFPMSDLAVVQLTRKRVRSSLLETVCQPCAYCGERSYY